VHAIVCIKQVPDTTDVKVNPETGTLIREGVPSIVNPFDTYAIEEALRLREKFGGKVAVGFVKSFTLSRGGQRARHCLHQTGA